MTSFRLDVNKFDDNIANYINIKKECIVDVNSTYNSLKNIDSGWNDNNTKSFLSCIKKDKYKIDSYFENIDKLYKQVENFKNGFENLFFKYGYKKSSQIVYDDAYYKECLTNLNNVISYLDNAMYYINCCHFGSDFPSSYRVYNLKNEIRSLKSTARSMYNGLITFKNTVDRILSNAKNGVSRLGNVNLNIEKMTYSWQLKDLQIVEKEIMEEEIGSVSQNIISTDSEKLSKESYLRNTVSAENVADNNINKNINEFNNVYDLGSGVTTKVTNGSTTNSDLEE